MKNSIYNLSYFRGFLTAINFLTIFPVKKAIPTEEELGQSTAFFPITGALIGLFLVFSDALLSQILPRQVNDIFLIGILIFITGAIHIDGLADTIDGFFSRKDRNGILDVMRDSRLGTMGGVGIFFFLILKFICLNSIASHYKSFALVVMPMFGRWSIVHMALISSYARVGMGLGRVFCEKVKIKHWLFASATSLFAGIVLLGWKVIIVFFFILLITHLLHGYSKRKICGVTGDVFGAVNEFNETLTLIILITIMN